MFDSSAARLIDTQYDTHSVHSIGVVARLSHDFTYSRFGVEVTLDAGTLVHVDEERMIASHGNDCFTVEHGDYVVSYLN